MQQGQQADKQWQQRPDRCCQPHVCVGGMQAAEAGADCPSPACMLDAGYRKTIIWGLPTCGSSDRAAEAGACSP